VRQRLQELLQELSLVGAVRVRRRRGPTSRSIKLVLNPVKANRDSRLIEIALAQLRSPPSKAADGEAAVGASHDKLAELDGETAEGLLIGDIEVQIESL